MDIGRKDAQLNDGSERDKLLAYYWRKGIPSVVLAIVTLILAGYSSWIVQPNIQQRYREICDRNFDALGEECCELQPYGDVRTPEADNVSNPADARIHLEFQETPIKATRLHDSLERRRVLEQTHLCLRRLIIWNKTDDIVRFQSARVSDLLAVWYLHRARTIARDESNGKELSALLAQSRSERRKATEAMRVVLKLNGPFADKAALWLTRRQLEDNLELPIAEIDTIANQVAKCVDRDSNNVIARLVLIELKVCQAFRFANPSTIDQRVELLRQADAMFQANPTSSILELGWAAEAKSISDFIEAQAVATQALQKFWASGIDNSHSVETLATVLRCLILVNSTKEAQLFVSERLPQISPIDLPRFRGLTSAACLRHVVLNAICDDRENALGIPPHADSRASQLMLSMAIQLNPESGEILSMLESIARPGCNDPILLRIRGVLGLIENLSSNDGDESNLDRVEKTGPQRVPAIVDAGLKSFLNAIVGLGAGADAKSTAIALEAAVKETPAYAIVASRLAIRLNASNSISTDLAIRWLRTINTLVPDVLIAWSDRASLHLKEKQIADAIECYEYLLKKLPGNEQIGDALESAKKQGKLEN